MEQMNDENDNTYFISIDNGGAKSDWFLVSGRSH